MVTPEAIIAGALDWPCYGVSRAEYLIEILSLAGYVIVPREPSDAMVYAGADMGICTEGKARIVYRAMVGGL